MIEREDKGEEQVETEACARKRRDKRPLIIVPGENTKKRESERMLEVW